MSTTAANSRGFTLLELLIALTISVTVLTGVYTTFDSLINTKEATEKSNYKNSLLLSARRVIKPDILQMYKSTLSIERSEENDTLSFVTNNSIKMEKAFPVTVTYYVDDDDYLVREEKSEIHDYEWSLYLLKNVSDFEIQTHNGEEFTDDYDPQDTIIKVTFEVSDNSITFIAGCGHVSRTTDYLGEAW